MKEDFAILIGINDYTSPTQKGLRTLGGAVNDANKLEKWVASATGGNVPAPNIKKIISSSMPLKPLQDEIDDAFLEIEATIQAQGGTARRLYFYFAGHGLGTLDSTTNTALCLANWSESRRQSALSSEEYKDGIKQYGYFEEIFFIADCCRNTKINIKPKAPTFSIPVPGQAAGQTKMFVAYATQYQDQSYEVESIDSEMRGAFTTVLIEGLNGAAANNGLVGVDDLRDFLIKATPELAQKQGYKQIPEISHTYSNNATLVEVQLVGNNLNIIFGATRNNPVELFDGDLNLIETIDSSQSKRVSRQLGKGLYQLRDTLTDETSFFQVPLSQNKKDVTF
ncbi:caspase family protein [Cellulophaga sp. BC115SP]|uniref:caspase family protein n=1 Tax=Cellulophaga sp. BC115SP TaxID=2683263 RepID=UPI001412F27D|nr:caspase family protein [Cellulophaga sp. BC115SP]NBB26997.1 hypothetical protein [Cellulophaga sp. BC115SP]